MKIALTQFGGIAPLVHPVNLSDFAAQAAENYRSDGGDLRPLIGPGIVPGVTLGRASDGVIRTVYRYGQDMASDTQYWLQWLSPDVSVQRGLIPGDTDERTFWTGDGGDGWSPDSGVAAGGTYYGFPKVAKNPGNAYALIFVPDSPLTALTQSQIDKLAYADCAPGGMMGAVCMTGTSVAGYGSVGTMSGVPVSLTLTRRP